MICLRCGYCCEICLNSVVRPEYIDSITSVDDLEMDMLLPVGKELGPCPYFSWDAEGLAVCAIHDKPWYKETPCYQYQSHLPGVPCMMGKHRQEERLKKNGR